MLQAIYKHMYESLFDYLLIYRIKKDLPHLMKFNCSITEAAFLVGYADSSYFSKVFRKSIQIETFPFTVTICSISCRISFTRTFSAYINSFGSVISAW